MTYSEQGITFNESQIENYKICQQLVQFRNQFATTDFRYSQFVISYSLKITRSFSR